MKNIHNIIIIEDEKKVQQQCKCAYMSVERGMLRKDFTLTSHALFVMVNSEKDNPSNDFPHTRTRDIELK